MITVICVFTSRNVGFRCRYDAYEFMNQEHLKKLNWKLAEIVDNDKEKYLFVSVGKNTDEAIQNYNATNKNYQY